MLKIYETWHSCNYNKNTKPILPFFNCKRIPPAHSKQNIFYVHAFKLVHPTTKHFQTHQRVPLPQQYTKQAYWFLQANEKLSCLYGNYFADKIRYMKNSMLFHVKQMKWLKRTRFGVKLQVHFIATAARELTQRSYHDKVVTVLLHHQRCDNFAMTTHLFMYRPQTLPFQNHFYLHWSYQDLWKTAI